MVVTFDNMSYSQVIGSTSAPYFNTLARGGANFTQSSAETYPAQPNLLALFSGSTQGVTDESCPHSFSTPNLGSDLTAAGLSFTGYAEDLPAAGPSACTSGDYTTAHVPGATFSNVPASATQPFTAFPGTSSYASLPTVSFVTPDICHDMGTCPITTSNAWLENRLGAYANWAVDNNSLLVVTFAEDDGSHGNHIPTIFYGAQVKPGNYSEAINHYSILRTLEDAYGLPHDGAAASAAPITDSWTYASTSPSPSTSVSTSPSSSPSGSGPPGAIPAFKHVVVVIFENRYYGQVIGSPSAPYFTALSKQGANFTQSYAETHPSEPNYLAFFSGSTQGVTSDACPQTFSKPNMAADLIAAGKTFGGYVDALPSSGPAVCSSGNYARKHVPWVNFTNVPASVTHNFTGFPQTSGGNFNALPDVSYVIPDHVQRHAQLPGGHR